MTDDNMRIADKQAMIDWVADGETPKSDWKIGTEHEKFLYRCDTKEPVVYEGPDGVAQLLSNLLTELGSAATPILEKGKIIGLKDGEGGSVTLEPGGQLELSGAPLAMFRYRFARSPEISSDPCKIPKILNGSMQTLAK